MKPTSDNFQPRRDGWFEHRATWGEVVVGTVLATQKRTERWEVIETAYGGDHVIYGYTLWFKIREMTTGEVHSVRPRLKNTPCTILTQNPADTRTGDPTEPTDADAVALLVKELGAEWLATRDHETGEITCPDYILDPGHLDGPGRRRNGLIEHMRFAHAIVLPADIRLEDLITQHARHHREPVGSGFPHRHVPEDISYIA